MSPGRFGNSALRASRPPADAPIPTMKRRAGVAFGAAPEALTLRLSGCDYDGEAALRAYQQGAKLDEAFIAKYAPNVVESIKVFGQFVRDVSGQTKAA